MWRDMFGVMGLIYDTNSSQVITVMELPTLVRSHVNHKMGLPHD